MANKNDHIKNIHSMKKSAASIKSVSTDDDDSALQKFNLGFEYDRSWNEAKHSVQLRPLR